MAEKGVHSCDEQKVEHACIIYGRRAMESRHTSVTLHNAIRPILHSVNRFYSRERVGRLYIVHFVNLVYSIFLSALLKPLLSLLDDSSKLVSVQTKLELRDYFDSNGLLLAGAGLEEWPKEGEEVLVPDTEMDRGVDGGAASAAAAEGGWREGKGPGTEETRGCAVGATSSSHHAEAEMTELKV
jgi:hypothetical protein